MVVGMKDNLEMASKVDMECYIGMEAMWSMKAPGTTACLTMTVTVTGSAEVGGGAAIVVVAAVVLGAEGEAARLSVSFLIAVTPNAVAPTVSRVSAEATAQSALPDGPFGEFWGMCAPGVEFDVS